MKKNRLTLLSLIIGVSALFSFNACKDDIDPIIEELSFDRLFTPISIEARVVNKINVRLNWAAVVNAKTYTIEFYENGTLDFTGTPVRTVENVTYDQLPIVITGFSGETDYSVRVKALGENIEESKWISTTFTTDAEQIFYAVALTDITNTGVTLRWPAGSVATSIVLTPGSITHTLTANEITAGVAVIDGLAGETEYTAKLMNGTKVRGTATFTTYMDISTAIVIEPGDDFKALVEAGTAGQKFAVLPGTYDVNGTVSVSANIVIVGALPYSIPVINGAEFRLTGGAGLQLKDLVIDGTTYGLNQCIIYNDAGTYSDLLVEGCTITNYVKGIIYVNVAALIESVTFDGNIFKEVECNGGDFIDFRTGLAKKFDFKNNTVNHCAWNRDLFRMDAGGSTNFPTETSTITIESNTFYNIINTEGTTRRILYIRLASHGITVNKNIFANTLANYSNQAATTVTSMSSNNYFNAANLYTNTFTVYDHWTYYTLDPGFVDPGNGDFTVTHEDLIYYLIGDPRWL